MSNYLFCLLITLFFFSCVSQDKYDKLNAEKVALQDELQELKYGAPNLLSDAKKFFQAKDYVQAKEKLQSLLEKHPDRPESAEAKSILSIINEEESWSSALNSPDVSSTNNYISQYPAGKYIVIAKKRLRELNLQKEKSDYDYALSQNTSSTWKSFLASYPNRADANEISKRIIKCEVDEIMGDRETGRLPSFEQTSFEYSSSSAVSITNDTGCELTVRYSGEDVKMIEIPAGGTRTVYLQSGNYKIAASACGANYAGTENLHGNYSSKYYIRTYSY